MARSTFSGPIKSDGGFEVGTGSSLVFTDDATTATNAANFSADAYITVTANGTTYYLPVATAAW